MNDLKKVNEFVRYPRNPFTDGVALKIMQNKRRKVLRKYKGKTVDPDTGELLEGLMKIEEDYVDNEVFAKTYVKAIKDHLDLSSRASRLFHHITLELEKDQTEMMLYPPHMADVLGYGEKTYYLALQELLINEVLARTIQPYSFYINPEYIYNGDRLVIVNSYLKKKDNDNVVINRNDKDIIPKEFENKQLIDDGIKDE